MRLPPLVAALALLAAAPRPARACIYASEADTLVGWSADGAYALYTTRGEGGALAHAEALPTRAGRDPVLWIEDEDGVVTVHARTAVDCQPWEGAVKERRKLGRKEKLTLDVVLELETVKKLALVRRPESPPAPPPELSVAWEPRKRYADHHLVLHAKDAPDAILDLPVTCVGSCRRDEKWDQWTARVVAVHATGAGPLYELEIGGMCNGAAGKAMVMPRLVAPRAAGATPPRRCLGGSGG